MAQDSASATSAPWTWPVDGAVARSGAERLALGFSALYAVGVLLLVASLFVALPSTIASLAAVMLLLGVAGSIIVLAMVLRARGRIATR